MEVAKRKCVESQESEPGPKGFGHKVVSIVSGLSSKIDELLFGSEQGIYSVSREEYDDLKRYADTYQDLYVNYALFNSRGVRFSLLENLDALYKRSVRRTLGRLNLQASGRDDVIVLVEDVIAKSKVV